MEFFSQIQLLNFAANFLVVQSLNIASEAASALPALRPLPFFLEAERIVSIRF